MADNFLERQMERYRSGKTVVRQLNPPLDLLLRRLADKEKTGGEVQKETDPARIVRKAQLEAALRSARILYGDSFRAELSEEEQCIILENKSCAEALGEIILAIRLKAAELGLSTATDHSHPEVTSVLFGR